MNRDEKVGLLRSIVNIRIGLTEGRIHETVSRLEGFFLRLEKAFGFPADDQNRIKLDIPVCICVDDRGWSTCGGPCPVHIPDYYCICRGCKKCTLTTSPFCQKKVAYQMRCVRCADAVES